MNGPLADIAAIFRSLDRPVWIVTAACGSQRGGLLATFVQEASIDPEAPRAIAGIAVNHFTHELIAGSGAFAAHLLNSQQAELALPFALESGRDHDKLAGLELRNATTGSPILSAAPAWMDCRVTARFDAGDRTFFLADVVDGAGHVDGPPLTQSQLLTAASPEQRGRLKADMQADIERQKPLLEAWRKRTD